MSGITFKNFTAKRGAPLLLVTAAAAAVLAGCGGGGSNGNLGGGTTGTTGTIGTTGTNTGGVPLDSSIIGKVTDIQGTGIPGANIVPDTGGSSVTTLSQGGYRLDNISGNVVHKITAALQQNGTTYTGSTQVFTESSSLVSNANIILSPTTKQVTVSGTVRDINRTPIANVRVFLALPTAANSNSAGNYSSLVAFTDANGFYSITNVPSDLPSTAPATVTASTSGAQNSTALLAAFQAGGTYRQDFTLNAAPTDNTVGIPAIVAVTTVTEPTDSQSGRLIARTVPSATGSVYDTLRRQLSPAYARTAGRHATTGKRLAPRILGAYAIETDLAFNDPAQTGSIIGYSIYRNTGSIPPTQTSANAYDFLQDPLANYYTDLTFSTNQSTTVANVQYNFAMSATNTSSNIETGLSPVFSVTPLNSLTLTTPSVGQSFVNPVTIAWTPITGAQRYYVLVYDQYPSVNVSPTFSSPTSGTTVIASTASSYALPMLGRGVDYYVIVAAGNDQNETPNQTTATPITNAALTFSQITRFHIQ